MGPKGPPRASGGVPWVPKGPPRVLRGGPMGPHGPPPLGIPMGPPLGPQGGSPPIRRVSPQGPPLEAAWPVLASKVL